MFRPRELSSILQYMLRATLAMVLTGLLLFVVCWLCMLLCPDFQIESYLQLENCLLSSLQLLPRVGNLVGELVTFGDVIWNPGSSATVSAMTEALFGLLILGIYKGLCCVYTLMKRGADKICADNRILCFLVDCFCHVLFLLSSAAVALALLDTIGAFLPAGSDWVWIIIMLAVIIGITIFAVRHKNSSKILRILLDLLLDIVAVFLIYIIILTSNCFGGAAYLSTEETIQCVIGFILAVLFLTVLMSYQFASIGGTEQ